MVMSGKCFSIDDIATGDTTCPQVRDWVDMCATCFQYYGEGWRENEFLFGASKSVSQAYTDFPSCQRLLGTTTLFEFILFYLIFINLYNSKFIN